MDKSFDDLFNEFLNNKEEEKKDSMSEESKRIMDIIKTLTSNKNIDESTENFIDITLGEPDSIETYSDGLVNFEKRVWHTPTGDIVKIIMSDIQDDFSPIQNKPIKKETSVPKSLQEQLDEAISNEEYERAAKIRDLMIEKNK